MTLAAACSGPGAAINARTTLNEENSKHRAEIETWRAGRLERLRREDGWLTLVGLFWLEEGENRFGTDPSNRVVFPQESAPARMGSFDLANGTVRLRVEPGVVVTHEGKPVTTLALASDAGGGPTLLQHGTLRFYVIKRGDRLGIRVKDSESPARRNFKGIESFSIDPAWRFVARFDPYTPARKMPVPNILGSPTSEISPGAVVFEAGGRSYRLDAVEEEGSKELFLIFGDKTNGHETYGGGRFLYAPRPGPDGKLVVDFNRAYNPPCVFTPYATCPLPPPHNKLPIRVEAGEKTYGEH